MKMILHNLDSVNKVSRHIKTEGERITAVYSDNEDKVSPDQTHLYFEDCFMFAGLINSHDHLDFNLFPQLGSGHYKNYLDWGNDIHRQNGDVIQAVLKVPAELRTRWGMYKNLLNGVTTVVQHGGAPVLEDAPLTVFTRCHPLHSVGLEKNWKYKLNSPFIPAYPFVIHIGEGTDRGSSAEIDQLLRWNLFKRKLVGIHGVAMNYEQAEQFEALIWCPDSNWFSLGATAAIDKIKTATKILFGTDSTLTADWNIWRQLRRARAAALLTDAELMASVSSLPAAVWKLNHTGKLKENFYADIVVTKKKNPADCDADAFFSSDPENIQLILNRGAVVFFDAALLTRLKNVPLKNYSKIFIRNQCKYVIGCLPDLIKKIKKYAPESGFPVDIE